MLGDDLRRGELLEFGERFAVELDPPSVPPAYARAMVGAYRKGQLTAARTVELLHRCAGEADRHLGDKLEGYVLYAGQQALSYGGRIKALPMQMTDDRRSSAGWLVMGQPLGD